jgi:hypothetical protein
MLVPLSLPVWARLYGPYGVQDVAGDLASLSALWDSAVADRLLWERLHHQETLYPVTYAALPWLRDIARRDTRARRDVLLFLSWIVYCALYPTEGQGPLAGLSLDLADHRRKWLPVQDWLVETDLPLLRGLSDWAEAEFPRIAEDCIAAMTGEEDHRRVSNLAWAPLSTWTGFTAARALEMFTEDEEISDIRSALELNDHDFSALHRLAVVARHGWLRDFAFQLDGREQRPEQDELPLS